MKKFDIGILGGGQLGRLILEEARAWGLSTKVMDPDPGAPSLGLADDFLCAELNDPAAIRLMARESRSLTIEIENIDASTLLELEEEGHRVLPLPRHLLMLQDKGLQKRLLEQEGIPTAPFLLLERPEDARTHGSMFPAMAKLRRAGYDGRGVTRFETVEEALRDGFRAPHYLEPLIDIHKELAVVVVRDEQGHLRSYPPVEMVFHKANLLDYLVAPADVPQEVAERATELALTTCRAINYIGVLAVELFWTKDHQLLVNELAPRVHNSGHHTREAYYTSQFGQIIRVLQGWPLGSVAPRTQYAGLLNIIGPEQKTGRPYYKGRSKICEEEATFLYIYGKKESRPNRKMGHITLLSENRAELLRRIEEVKAQIEVEVNEEQ